MWKASVKDIDGEILCVSQFTLMANTTKGNKPDFHRAMSTEPSRELYATFLEELGKAYKAEKIKDGRFGAMMNVSLTNEGPVTFTLDSRKFEYAEHVSDPLRSSGVSTTKHGEP
ncbi:putative deacylase [Lyophyllum shimeji]|uniref:D-aminoacyl-tRNA deacylase n=1 Tax=Lyophyllum shimeji TaxID=47721 RepID=A0A9P3PET7_LYOSH|nr:putative deacylase [Lyophyllum shimeji]